MDYNEFIEKLRSIASPDTSADPSRWTPHNPLWGHCAAASLVAQDIYGGTLMKGSLEEYRMYPNIRFHCWSRIGETDVDFTGEQFPDFSHKELEGEACSRESLLEEYPEVFEKYERLKKRLQAFEH